MKKESETTHSGSYPKIQTWLENVRDAFDLFYAVVVVAWKMLRGSK